MLKCIWVDRMADEALIELTGVYGILKSLHDFGEMPMTHLQSEIPNYQRLSKRIDALQLEGMIAIRQGDKRHIKLVSLTPKGVDYIEHILDAESLRDLDLVDKNKKL